MGISLVAFTYASMISIIVNRDDRVIQFVAPGSSRILIRVLENV